MMLGLILWIVQAILCIKFLSVAYTHGFGSSNPQMQKSRLKLGLASRPLHLLAALGAFFGCLCLVLPAVNQSLAWMASIGAAWLAVLMAISIGLHLASREKPLVVADLVLLALAAFVAYGRWAIAPI
jgi:hypothetical protein